MTPRPRTRPRPRARGGHRVALVLAGVGLLSGIVLSVALAGTTPAGAVDLPAPDAPGDPTGASAETVPPDDPDLERRIAEDVAAFVNSERRARGLPLLGLAGDAHARAANEDRLREREPDDQLLEAYGVEPVTELFVRLGTGTRSGEAVAGWLAGDDAEVLLDADARGIAVAAACQPGERGGDLVLTVHVLTTVPSDAPGPVAADRPGAGRGEACQFADLATGPTAEDGVVAPAALAAAGAVTLALVLLEVQRRRHRVGFTAPPPPIDGGPGEPDPSGPPADSA